MAIRAIAFDIGGVLEVAPQTGWEKSWEEQLGLEQGEVDKRLLEVWRDGSSGKMSEADVERNIRAILGLDQEQLDAFMADLWDEYMGTLNTELADYFAALRPRFKTSIISNSFAGAREKEHERYGFGDLCDLIVYSHEVGIAKPNRRIYELAAEGLGVQPNEMIFLDDKDGAIIGAREVGIHAILFQNNAQAIADIEAIIEAEGQEQ